MADLAALQTELKAAKERWEDLKLGKGKKESSTFPFPVSALLAVQTPPSAKAFDVSELPVKLIVEGLEDGQVQVEVPSAELPPQLQARIAEEVLKAWGKGRGKKSPWGITPAFDWVEANFAKLLMSDPECLNPYEGCDDEGATMRRYAIAAPAAPVEDDEESESDEDDSEAEREAQLELQERMRALLLECEPDSQGKKKLTPEEIERRKQEVAEMGEKAKQLSKSERAEQNKSRKEKSGHRTAKTGQKSHKFEGEGATSKADKKKKAAENVKKRFGI